MITPAVEVERVRYAHGASFGLVVPHLRIAPGERVALVGPSGSGKTTLLDLIAGIRAAQSGSVRVLGQELTSMTQAGRRALRLAEIGLAFQEFELLEYLSARENILLSTMVGASSAGAATEMVALARASGIEHVLDRPPARLSQGERQRVSLCRALVTRPKLILCDEPTGNLDRRSAGAVMDLLFQQADRTGAAVLMATHDLGVLGRFERTIDVASWSGVPA